MSRSTGSMYKNFGGSGKAHSKTLKVREVASKQKSKHSYEEQMALSSISDLELYFAGDSLECLECGMYFKSLALHLHNSHSMHRHEYNMKYGIPRSRKLVPASHHAKLSKQKKEFFEANPEQLEKTKKHMSNLGKTYHGKPSIEVEPTPLTYAKMASRNKELSLKESELREVFSYMRTHQVPITTAAKVTKHCPKSIAKSIKKYKAEQELEKIICEYPFHLLLRVNPSHPRLVNAAKELSKQSCTYIEIAAQLGIGTKAVKRLLTQ